MALPKLVGQGISSAAGAIGKSVKTGAKAFGAMALSQMEPEVLAGVAGVKTLAGKFKGRAETSGNMSESEDLSESGNISQLQRSVEEVPSETATPIVQTIEQIPPETATPIVQTLEQIPPETATPIIEKLEQIPPETAIPIVQKIEELKEVKESELNLEPVLEKLDELSEKDNPILEKTNNKITSIEKMFSTLMKNRKKEKSDNMEEDREEERRRLSKLGKQGFLKAAGGLKKAGGGLMSMISGLFKGGGLIKLLGGLLAGGGMITVIGGLLSAVGGVLAAALPIIIPLILTAALAAAVWAFLESELADDISTWLGEMFYDSNEAMKDLNANAAAFASNLRAAQGLKAEEDGNNTSEENDDRDKIEEDSRSKAMQLVGDELNQPGKAKQSASQIENMIKMKQVELLIDTVNNSKDPKEAKSALLALKKLSVRYNADGQAFQLSTERTDKERKAQGLAPMREGDEGFGSYNLVKQNAKRLLGVASSIDMRLGATDKVIPGLDYFDTNYITPEKLQTVDSFKRVGSLTPDPTSSGPPPKRNITPDPNSSEGSNGRSSSDREPVQIANDNSITNNNQFFQQEPKNGELFQFGGDMQTSMA